MSRGITLYNSTEKLLNSSRKYIDINYNTLVNYLIKTEFPTLLKKFKIKDSKLLAYANVIKKKAKRDLIIEIGKEEQRKYYFLSRFIAKWRGLMRKPYGTDREKKEMLLRILSIYIEESKSYFNNDATTIKLIKYYTSLKNSKLDLKMIGDLFELNLLKIDSLDRTQPKAEQKK